MLHILGKKLPKKVVLNIQHGNESLYTIIQPVVQCKHYCDSVTSKPNAEVKVSTTNVNKIRMKIIAYNNVCFAKV